MVEDIRDKAFVGERDLLALNFIRSPSRFVFRRHYRTGLRSHILEVLNPREVRKERKGVFVGTLKAYPRARPLKILRIFRTKFSFLKEAMDEIATVKVAETYLAPRFMAVSEEFLVHYKVGERYEIMLCGLQVYVPGAILNPWTTVGNDPLAHITKALGRMSGSQEEQPDEELMAVARGNLEEFVRRIKRMVRESGYIPDLAGVGNIVLTPEGRVCQVDINNISRVSFQETIPLDDRGYPVCDKSAQALAMLETRWLGKEIDFNNSLYRIFLAPERVEKVRRLEKGFHERLKAIGPFGHML